MAFPTAPGIDRRTFLKVSAISGVGFAIACLPFKAGAVQSQGLPFGNFVRVSRDNTVTVVIKHLDKGQGITTGLTAIVAEELDADMERHVETYRCEWTETLEDPARMARFIEFVNAPDENSTPVWISERGRRMPAPPTAELAPAELATAELATAELAAAGSAL